MVLSRSKKLDVSIRREKASNGRFVYRITIDGDEFFSSSYEGAVLKLMYILLRDEFPKSYRLLGHSGAFSPKSFGQFVESIPDDDLPF